MTYTAEASVHSTAVKVDVFPDEFMPLLKVINCAILMPDKFALTTKELDTLIEFQDKFADVALNEAV
jgi:hypothetical protein